MIYSFKKKLKSEKKTSSNFFIPSYNTKSVQLMGYTLASCGVSGTNLVGCVSLVDMPRTSRVRPHQPLAFSEGLGLSPGVWGAPFWGSANGVRGILGAARPVWNAALCLDLP